ncbi:hypothetical protein PPACK8108_LOCUS19806, partial [Phakopsora pachyrhizi]
MINQILIVAGSALFFNGAYSVYAERILLHGGTSLQYIPSKQLILQLIGSTVLLIFGITLSSTPLRDIYWKTELKQRSIDSFDSKMGFLDLNNRASILVGN